MALTWGIAFLSCLLVFSSVSGETAPCMTSREECMKTGFSSVSVINNRYLCCAPGFSMSVVSGQCTCTKTSTTRNCDKGPKACSGARMLSSDGQGNTLCCPSGFSMSHKVTSINGMVSKSCTCSQGLGGGSSIYISGNNTSNSTAVRQQWQKWQQKLQTSMTQSMAVLHKSMQDLRNRMHGFKNRLYSMFRNIFHG